MYELHLLDIEHGMLAINTAVLKSILISHMQYIESEIDTVMNRLNQINNCVNIYHALIRF